MQFTATTPAMPARIVAPVPFDADAIQPAVTVIAVTIDFTYSDYGFEVGPFETVQDARDYRDMVRETQMVDHVAVILPKFDSRADAQAYADAIAENLSQSADL
jgi:hypothetical protein